MPRPWHAPFSISLLCPNARQVSWLETTPKDESMADEITRFPGAASISFDELLATVDDAAGDYNQLFRIALKSFQNAGPSIRPDTGAEVKDFFEDLALAYFAMGTLLGAKRELMVKSLRPSSA